MVNATLMHWWLIPIVIAVVAIALVIGWFARGRDRERRHLVWVSNAAYLTALPSFRSRLSRYRGLIGLLAVVLLAASVFSGILLSRPVDKQVRSDELATRDIVLCLDVSGSMIEYDTEIVERFLELVPSFHGERISLSIFNSTSRTVFPLTDDYQLVERELSEAADALDFDVDSLNTWSYDSAALDRLLRFLKGTEGMGKDASSLVGDGLATCALGFDEKDQDRSRSIILATDNEVFGDPLYTLPQAADLVSKRDITLNGFYAGATTKTSAAQEKEYKKVVEDNGGLFFASDDPDAVKGIVDQITAKQAVALDSNPKVIITDRGEKYFPFLVGAIGIFLVLAWRVRS